MVAALFCIVGSAGVRSMVGSDATAVWCWGHLCGEGSESVFVEIS